MFARESPFRTALPSRHPAQWCVRQACLTLRRCRLLSQVGVPHVRSDRPTTHSTSLVLRKGGGSPPPRATADGKLATDRPSPSASEASSWGPGR